MPGAIAKVVVENEAGVASEAGAKFGLGEPAGLAFGVVVQGATNNSGVVDETDGAHVGPAAAGAWVVVDQVVCF